MIEQAPMTALAELSDTLAELRAELTAARQELDTTIQAWQSAIVSEKKDFQELYAAKSQEWATREKDWQEQRAAYEQKINELDSQFRTQLGVTEQNALQALNELDDSWQRDKLQWNQGAAERLRELESRQTNWVIEREKQEAFINDLQRTMESFKETVVDRLTETQTQQQLWVAERQSLVAALAEAQEQNFVVATTAIAVEEFKQNALHEQALLENALRRVQQQASDEHSAAEQTLIQTRQKSAEDEALLRQRLTELESSIRDMHVAQTQAINKATQDVHAAWEGDRAHWQAATALIEQEWATKEAEWRAEHQKRLAAFELLEKQYVAHQETERKAWSAERETLQKLVGEMANKVEDLEAAREAHEAQALQETRTAWDLDKQVWQQSLQHFHKQQLEKEAAWEDQRKHYEHVVAKLENDLAQLQNQLAQQEKAPTRRAPEQFLETTIESLEGQISVINELVKQMTLPAPTNGHASQLRRRSDLVEINDPTRVFR